MDNFEAEEQIDHVSVTIKITNFKSVARLQRKTDKIKKRGYVPEVIFSADITYNFTFVGSPYGKLKYSTVI